MGEDLSEPEPEQQANPPTTAQKTKDQATMNWNNAKFWKKFVLWLIFGVAIPLLAVGVVFLTRWFHLNKLPDFFGLLSNGEVALVATVLAAAAAGEGSVRIIEHRKGEKRPLGDGMGDLLVIVCSLLVALASACTAAVIIAAGPDGTDGSHKNYDRAPAIAAPRATEGTPTGTIGQTPAAPSVVPPASGHACDHGRPPGHRVTDNTQSSNSGPAIASIIVFVAAVVAGFSNVLADSFD